MATIDPWPPVEFEKVPWIRSFVPIEETAALPRSVLVPRVMVNETVVPSTVPFMISRPTGDVMVPENAPVEGLSVLMSMVSASSDSP